MGKLKLALKFSPWLIVALLALAVWHYNRAADRWHMTADTQQKRADGLQRDNAGLEAANSNLNARNTNLVETLNERNDDLKSKDAELNSVRRRYSSALDKNTDWSRTVVPDSVADSLRSPADIQDRSRSGDKSAKRAN